MKRTSTDAQPDISVIIPDERYAWLFAYRKMPFICVVQVLYKGVAVIVPVFGHINQSVSDLRCDFGTCLFDEFHITVSHIDIFLCQPVFMVV